MTDACDHEWIFYSCGIDGDALRGRGPQRANFRCTKCTTRARMVVKPGTCDPDLMQPVYHIWIERRVYERRRYP